MTPEAMAAKWLSLCEVYDKSVATEIASYQRKFNPEEWGRFTALLTIKDTD